jgi:hypothetical protein
MENTTGMVWAESLWITRRESLSIDGIQREVSLGMAVKNDYKETSSRLYLIAEKAITKLFEQEEEKWLSKKNMHSKLESIKGDLIMEQLPSVHFVLVSHGKSSEVISLDEFQINSKEVKEVIEKLIEEHGIKNIRYCLVKPVDYKHEVTIG